MPQCPHENLVGAYLDGELKGQDRARFKEHLASCPHCQALAAQMMDIEDQLRSGMRPIDVQSGSDIASSVQQALSRTGQFRRVRRRKWWDRHSGSLSTYLLRVAILVLVLVVTIWAANRYTRVPSSDLPGAVSGELQMVPPAGPTPDDVLASAEALLADLVRSGRREPGAARRLRDHEAVSGVALRLTSLADGAIDRHLRADLVHLSTVVDQVAALRDDSQAASMATQVEQAAMVDTVRRIRQQVRREGM